MSHFFLHRILLVVRHAIVDSADSLSLQLRDKQRRMRNDKREGWRESKKGEREKKQRFGYQKAAHNVMGAYSEFIEMLCMFHSTCLICVSNMASARYV